MREELRSVAENSQQSKNVVENAVKYFVRFTALDDKSGQAVGGGGGKRKAGVDGSI